MRKIGMWSLMVAGGVMALWVVGCETSSSPESPNLVIDPSTLSISTVEVAVNTNGTTNVVGVATASNYVFTVGGGNGVYTWSESDLRLGTLTASGSSATYTPNMIAGVNMITVTSEGNTAGAVITQQ